jgi:hypothetical protein
VFRRIGIARRQIDDRQEGAGESAWHWRDRAAAALARRLRGRRGPRSGGSPRHPLGVSAVRAPPALLPGRAIIGSQRKKRRWAYWPIHLRSRAFR